MTNFLSAARGFHIFAFVFFLAYGIVPTAYWLAGYGDIYFLLLGGLTALSLLSMILGYYAPLLDYFLRGAKRIRVSPLVAKWWIPLAFVGFIIYTLATAPSIPILSALSGDASAVLLSEERGAFLKGRSGIEISLLYISTIFVSTFVPYSLVVLFALKHKLRYFLFAAFFFYSISFLQKALFLNVLTPLLVLYAANSTINKSTLLKFFLVIVGLLLALIALTMDAHDSSTSSRGDADFLSAKHSPSGALDFFLWRVLAVPIFTATDTLVVHDLWFRGDQMLGATSSFVSQIFDLERVNIERHVFEYQFGGWNDIANSNAVFFLDGYVNFGVIGVIIYSLIAGQFFRVFAKTRDRALSTLWIIFGRTAFSGSLLGMLLSNGWILILVYALFFKNRGIEKIDDR